MKRIAPDQDVKFEMIEDRAPAKINLFLHVLGRRPDGYHILDSLVAFATIADRMTVREEERLTLDVVGPFAAASGPVADNLVLKAARELQRTAGISTGAHFRLEKNIPAGAGLGGGSSDAATALLLLDRLWGTGLPKARLAEIGLGLGADIPVCLHRRPMRMVGIGEGLTPVPSLPALPLLLVHPGGNLATKAVFQALNGRFGERPAEPKTDPSSPEGLFSWLAETRNDLETPAFGLRRDIETVLAELRAARGCRFARMSGSGASCFAFFETDEAAGLAETQIAAGHPGWWVQYGHLSGQTIFNPEV